MPKYKTVQIAKGKTCMGKYQVLLYICDDDIENGKPEYCQIQKNRVKIENVHCGDPNYELKAVSIMLDNMKYDMLDLFN